MKMYVVATTSAVSWLPHGGCAVLVDDPDVISEDSHLGSNPSRGNPQPQHPESHHPGQTPPGPFQYFFVYEPLQDAVQELQGSGTSPRRMRRSVSHDLPPRMDTHPPDSPTPATDPHSPDPPSNPHVSRSHIINHNHDSISGTHTSASQPDTFNSHSNPLPPHNTPPSLSHHNTPPSPSPHNSPILPSAHLTTNTNSPQHNHHTHTSSQQHLLTLPNTDSGPRQPDPILTGDNTVVRPERRSWSATHNSRVINSGVQLTNLHSFNSNEGSPLNNNAHVRAPLSPDRRSSFPVRPLSGGKHTNNHVKFLDAMAESADDVFDPVVDVVEYSNVAFDSELPEDNADESDDYYDNSDPIYNSIEADVANQDSEATDETEDTEVRPQEDYEFGRSLEEVDGDVVEYEQDTSTVIHEVHPVPNHSQPRLADPNLLLANTAVRNESFEVLPVPLEDSDPNVTLSDGTMALQDRMVGDGTMALQDRMMGDGTMALQDRMVGDGTMALQDRMMGDAPASGSGRKVLRSWMGSFPTIASYTDEVEAGETKQLIPDVFGGLGQQGPGGASWFSRRPNSEESSQNSTVHSLPPLQQGRHSGVDTWFTRYGADTSDSEQEGNLGRSVRRMTEYERILFSSTEGAAGRSARSAARKRSGATGYRSSYDPRDPNGGPVPQSSPDRYPSRILESMGVPHYQESTRTSEITDNRDSESNKDPIMARDVFPHIFEYDLDDHDDYYYDDPEYYYFDDYASANVRPQTDIDDFEDVPDEDEPDDVILDDTDDRDDLGVVEAGHRSPDSVITMSSASQRLPVLAPTRGPISATHYPPDLRALALTKEEFHVGVAGPQVKTISHGEEVVEIEVVPLYPEPIPSSNIDTGPNYAPAANREVNIGPERHYEEIYETEGTTRSTASPHRLTRSTPPPPTPSSTLSPTFSPHHNANRGSVPLQLAKFMPTRTPEHDVRTGQVSEGRKIPKFLKHISDQLSSLTRDTIPTDNTATSHGHQGMGGTGYTSSNSNYRMHASQPSEREITSTNIEISSHGSSGYHHSQTNFDDDVDEWTSTGDTHSTSQVHPNTRTSNESPRDVRHQESITPNTGYRFDRSPQQNSDTSTAFHVGTNSRHSKRVTVNVTIATDDGSHTAGDSTHAETPLYVLSVSVPTSGGSDQQADITLLEPAEHKEVASVSLSLHGNQTHAGLQHGQQRGQPGQCQCPCPCNSDSRPYTSSNSIPIPQHFLPDSDSDDSSHTDQHTHSRGCVLNPNTNPNPHHHHYYYYHHPPSPTPTLGCGGTGR
ncbi:hypothetical protein Pmani_028211 [Petrolisthes manimaculis]|uniref:Uncharacterized protein n=1 Tax=Petrolisthes manimaculis TaxID=1843537 RepID=A0AAE1TY74_9EUCA|nr:hypothetical protein Pmani_028211 [Petrolisthes manimaculis]